MCEAVDGPVPGNPPPDWLDRIHTRVFGEGQDANRDIYSFLFSRKASYGALGLLCVAGALPSDGAGVQVCLFRYVTGLPCPGCGLTRSFSSILHLHFVRAYDYHPFGYILLPLFILAAALLFVPAQWRERWEVAVRAHTVLVRRAYLATIYGFMSFGALRIAVYAIQGLHAL